MEFVTRLQIDVKIQQDDMVHLVRKIGNRPAVEELILVTGVHIEMFPKRPVDAHEEPVLVESGRWSFTLARTDRVEVDKDFIVGHERPFRSDG